jgi:nitrite reductase/ring-hydroxylating ferredoxin subunit
MKLRSLPSTALSMVATVTVMLQACQKDTPSGAPPTLVDFTVNVNNPSYVDLAVPGGWVYVSGGNQGIIIYRKTIDEFVAMDRLCMYQPSQLCRVHVDESEVIARDTTCCTSAYLLIDGSVTEGPTTLGLVRYNTTFNGTTLRVFN